MIEETGVIQALLARSRRRSFSSDNRLLALLRHRHRWGLRQLREAHRNASLANYLWAIAKPLHALDVEPNVLIGYVRADRFVILLNERVFPGRRIKTNRYLIGTDSRSAGGQPE